MQLPTDVGISSHRPGIGPLIVLYKKLVRLVVRPYLRSVFEREHELLEERFAEVGNTMKGSALQVEAISEAMRAGGARERTRDERMAAIQHQLAETRQVLEDRAAQVEAGAASLVRDTVHANTQDILKRTDSLMMTLDKRIETLSIIEDKHAKRMDASIASLAQRVDALSDPRIDAAGAWRAHLEKPAQATERNTADNAGAPTTPTLDMLRQYVDEQILAHRRDLVAVVEGAVRSEAGLKGHIDDYLVAQRRDLAAVEAALARSESGVRSHIDDQIQAQHRDLVAIADAMNRHRVELEKLITERVRDLRSDVNDVAQDVTLQKRRLDLILDELRSNIPPDHASLARIAAQKERLLDHAYFLFENRFRGSSEQVRKRQDVYLPVFAETRAALAGRFSQILDIGCGRGEMLELLKQHEIPARGIDLNDDMVLACQNKGLAVVHAEALDHLRGLPDGSLSGIISCQLVEHLPSDVLIEFARLCFDKAAKGARVILETVNPGSVIAMRDFYLDLTHERPIPPHALSFLLEAVGFARPEIRYLAPFTPEEMLDSHGDKNLEKLNMFLFGHQDYAVIVEK